MDSKNISARSLNTNKNNGFSTLLVSSIIAGVVSVVVVGSGALSGSREYLIRDEIDKEQAYQLALSGLESIVANLTANPIREHMQNLVITHADTVSPCNTNQWADTKPVDFLKQSYPAQGRQPHREIVVRVAIKQADCNQPLSNSNFRMKVEAVGRINCNLANIRSCTEVVRTHIFEPGQANGRFQICVGKPSKPAVNCASSSNQIRRTPLIVGGKIRTECNCNPNLSPSIIFDFSRNIQNFSSQGFAPNNFLPMSLGRPLDGDADKVSIQTQQRRWDPATRTLNNPGAAGGNSSNISIANLRGNYSSTASALVDQSLSNIVNSGASLEQRKDSFLRDLTGFNMDNALQLTRNMGEPLNGASYRTPTGPSLLQLNDPMDPNNGIVAAATGLRAATKNKSATVLVSMKIPPQPLDGSGNPQPLVQNGVDGGLQRLPEYNAKLNELLMFNDFNKTPNGTSDNVVVVIDGNINLRSLSGLTGIQVIVLGNLYIDGDITFYSNLAVMGDLVFVNPDKPSIPSILRMAPGLPPYPVSCSQSCNAPTIPFYHGTPPGLMAAPPGYTGKTGICQTNCDPPRQDTPAPQSSTSASFSNSR